MDEATEEKKSIKVAVVGCNAMGEADVYHCTVECTESEVALGVHYELAETIAEDDDFEPKLCVDEHERLYATLRLTEPDETQTQLVAASEAYKRFALATVGEFQDAFVPGQECDGGDLVERLGGHLARFMMVDLPAAGVALKLTYGYTEEGYVDGGSGSIFAPDDVPNFTVLPEEIERLTQVVTEAGGVLIEASAAEILSDVAAEIPCAAQLQASAESGRERALQHDFKISRDNAVEVMQSELEMYGGPLAPESFGPVLALAMRAAPEAEVVRNSPKG